MPSPSISVRNWGSALSRASVARQSYSVGPVRAQLLHVRERDALRPVVDRLGLGPAGAAQPLAQVDELVLGDVDAERRHVGAQRSEAATCSRTSIYSCMPTSIPELRIMSRSSLLVCCTSSASIVRLSTSVNVTRVQRLASSSGMPS